jgi:hypothetical protein
MRNRFVPRRLHATRQTFCRQHRLFFHAKILARRLEFFFQLQDGRQNRAPRSGSLPPKPPALPQLPVPPYSFFRSTSQRLRGKIHPTLCVLLSEENCNVSA